MCTNLPRRYVLPLDVKENDSDDQNLINLQNTTATAVKTETGVCKIERSEWNFIKTYYE